ncbi:hypothetical protein RYX36_009914, partial [Vicia faba]
ITIACLNFGEPFDYNTTPFKKIEPLRTFFEFDPPIRNMDAFPSITHLQAFSTSSIQLSALKNLTHLKRSTKRRRLTFWRVKWTVELGMDVSVTSLCIGNYHRLFAPYGKTMKVNNTLTSLSPISTNSSLLQT